jgi:cellobiose epimerase
VQEFFLPVRIPSFWTQSSPCAVISESLRTFLGKEFMQIGRLNDRFQSMLNSASLVKIFACLFLLIACAQIVSASDTDGPASHAIASSPPTVGETVNPEELQNLAKRAEQELRDNILPFWLKYSRNSQRDGFYGAIDENMKALPDAPRGALLTSRILWTFSTAYRIYQNPEYLEMARWAYRDLSKNFQDREYGGLFWTITAAGKPLDSRKQIYGQVFGIYALAEYFRATGEQTALDEAIVIFRLVEQHAHDGQNGGYFDSFDRKWKRTSDRNNLLGRAAKSQNSHIHILEAYSNLLRAWPDSALRENQRSLIEVTLKHLIDPRTHHLILFLKPDWTPLSDEISYGHDIELSWLLGEAAQVLGDPAVTESVKPVALAIAQATLAEGVDSDGGLINAGNPKGFTDTNKDWWPQAEAAVGFLNAYQLSSDPRYFTAAQRSWDFIDTKIVDHVNGDWIEAVNREGKPELRLKVTLWKDPYHSSRSCFELMERVRHLTGAPVKP